MSTIVVIIRVEGIPGVVKCDSYLRRAFQDCIDLANKRHACVDINVNGIEMRINERQQLEWVMEEQPAAEK